MPDTFDFAGKVVLVTGSSRGIGEAMIAAFSGCGARCVVNYVSDPDGRNKADADQVASKLKDALIVECDVSADQSVERMMSRIASQLGGLDILVNNAGILRDRTIKKMTPAEWDAVLKVNLTGAFNCIHHATPILRDGGRIVNIASLSAAIGIFGQANYAASKAGLIALTKVAARELAKQRITVNAIAPGVIQTEIIQAVPEDVKKQYLQQIPLGEFGQVADVVNAAMFLCSTSARYITGQVIHVNGGMLMP
jgi:3-oxoacyl-[acyl-carrier protein] reductase